MNMIRSDYGNLESNPTNDEIRGVRDSIEETIYLDDPRLKRITRLRLVSDPGFPLWDLSYCYGELKDGTNVRVNLPEHQLSKRDLKGDIIAMCRQLNLFAKGLGLLDDSVISKLV